MAFQKQSILVIFGMVALGLTACKTVPDPEPEPEIIAEPVEITAETPDCIPPELLTREVIPAVVKRGYHITSIESPPEYYTDPETGQVTEIQSPPIENKTPYEKIVEPEQVIWRDKDGNAVTNVCLPEGETLESYIPG